MGLMSPMKPTRKKGIIMFEVSRSEMAKSLSILGKLFAKNVSKSRQVVRLEYLYGKLSLTTQNTEEELSVSVTAEGDAPCRILISFSELKNGVKSLKDELLIFVVQEKKVILQNKFKLDIIPMETWKPFALCPVEIEAVNTPVFFLDNLAQCSEIIDDSEVRRVLRGINLSDEGFVATNGKFLLHISHEFKLKNIIIPVPRALLSVKRDSPQHLFKVWDQYCMIRVGNWSWTAKLINGTFPDWHKVLIDPKRIKCSVDIYDPTDKLSKELNLLPKSIRDDDFVIINQNSETELKIAIPKHEKELIVQARFTNDFSGVKLHVNRAFFTLMMNHVYTTLDICDNESPFVLKNTFGKCVAMPIRVYNRNKEVQTPKETITTNPEESAMTNNEIQTPETTAVNPLEDLDATIDTLRSKCKALFDETSALNRKVKEALNMQRTKEREYQQAQRTLEKIRLATAA